MKLGELANQLQFDALPRTLEAIAWKVPTALLSMDLRSEKTDDAAWASIRKHIDAWNAWAKAHVHNPNPEVQKRAKDWVEIVTSIDQLLQRLVAPLNSTLPWVTDYARARSADSLTMPVAVVENGTNEVTIETLKVFLACPGDARREARLHPAHRLPDRQQIGKLEQCMATAQMAAVDVLDMSDANRALYWMLYTSEGRPLENPEGNSATGSAFLGSARLLRRGMPRSWWRTFLSALASVVRWLGRRGPDDPARTFVLARVDSNGAHPFGSATGMLQRKAQGIARHAKEKKSVMRVITASVSDAKTVHDALSRADRRWVRIRYPREA